MTSIFSLSFILVFLFKLFTSYLLPENPVVKSSRVSTMILKSTYDFCMYKMYIIISCVLCYISPQFVKRKGWHESPNYRL
jgi:hypothetical protein